MEDFSNGLATDADVSTSIFQQHTTNDSHTTISNRLPVDEEEPSSTVYIEDISEDYVTAESVVKEEDATVATNNTSFPINDPITESYKSIISLINRTSEGFKEGKKWKCNSTCHHQRFRRDSSATRENRRTDHCHRHHHRNCHCHRRHHKCSSSSSRCQEEEDSMLAHSKTVDEGPRGNCSKQRQLVRQMATTDDPESADECFLPAETADRQTSKRLRAQGRMPSRQWTVDCSSVPQEENTGEHNPALSASMVISSGNTAFLLRPVSRTSMLSTGQQELDLAQSRNPVTRAAIAAAVAAAGGAPASAPRHPHPLRQQPIMSQRAYLKRHAESLNSSFAQSAEVSLSSAPNVVGSHHRLKKQRTSESAPSPRFAGGRTIHLSGGGGHLNYFPRQHSTASAYSVGANVLSQSYSHQGITLVRGASCSLVDIPTYLGPSVHASGGVELAQVGAAICKSVPMAPAVDRKVPARSRPRLQLDLTRKKNAKSTRKTKWTVLCVSLTLLTMCVTLVGTMLSIGSQYQDMVMARRQWDADLTNRTTKSVTTLSPFATKLFGKSDVDNTELFVIMPEEDIDKGSSNNDTTAADVERPVAKAKTSILKVKASNFWGWY